MVLGSKLGKQQFLLMLCITRLLPIYTYTVTDRIALLENLFNDIETNKHHNNINKKHQNHEIRLEDYNAETKEHTRDDNIVLRYDVVLDNKQRFYLRWDIDEPVESVQFMLEVKLKPGEFFGFGFSDYGDNENADLVVYWSDLAGNHFYQDAHTDGEGKIIVDKQQDYSLDNIQYQDDGVIITFHRSYDTCDDDDYIIDSGTTHVIFFTGEGPLPQMEGIYMSRVQTGLNRVQLIKSQLPDTDFPPDTKVLTVTVDEVPIPEEETTYWCKVKKLPHLPKTHHVIQFEGAISPAGEGIVHHLEVFHCEVPPGHVVPNYDSPCGNMAERPPGLESCRKVIGAWAMGAKALTYPEEAGYPIGGPGYSQYVMLEIHYNNPEHIKGIVDSSGLRFYITPTLRRFDAGVMELGLEYTDKHALPPAQHRWNLEGYCISECTHVALPPKGINIFASQLHTHLTGKRAYTKHYRRGIELPELNRDNHYSPHYQEIRKLPKQVRVLPGDALVTTCEDTTANLKNITLGGFSISDEMCVNYVHYYPKVELEVCKSSVTTESLYGFFRFMKEYQGEKTSMKYGISDNYHSIRWTPMNAALLKTFYDTAGLSMQCNQSDGRKFPGVDWEDMPKTKVLFPMPPTERPCLQ